MRQRRGEPRVQGVSAHDPPDVASQPACRYPSPHSEAASSVPTCRMTAHIFQIYYSDETRRALDPGFRALDNSKNERPDWREYWPIRNYFRDHALVEGDALLGGDALVEGDYYGFLSPAFKAKTGLSSATVFEFLERQEPETDVVLFSPFYDQIAFFLNQWEQGAMTHRNVAVFEESLALVAPQFKIYDTASSALNSVFCNYFVAKPAFWRVWLERCERVFACAERGDTPLGLALAKDIDYGMQRTPTKVFIIERVASALLAISPEWRVQAYNPMLLPLSQSTVSGLGEALVALDALKIAFAVAPHQHYKRAFFQLRARFAEAQGKRTLDRGGRNEP